MKRYIERLAWGTDAGFYRLIPKEVLHPANEADVLKIIRRAHKEKKHITFRAAGTSLSGQAISDSLLVVCGKKWETIYSRPCKSKKRNGRRHRNEQCERHVLWYTR